ncbi:hypothetical protein L1887_32719 [Cichorium endivia]|nr:hypothetical protein L1887_32719 [Cichorium endivia]
MSSALNPCGSAHSNLYKTLASTFSLMAMANILLGQLLLPAPNVSNSKLCLTKSTDDSKNLSGINHLLALTGHARSDIAIFYLMTCLEIAKNLMTLQEQFNSSAQPTGAMGKCTIC